MPREHIRMSSNEVGRGWTSVGWDKLGGAVQMATARELATGEASAWVDFPSRTEINDLIRLLRKARDQAFGRDE